MAQNKNSNEQSNQSEKSPQPRTIYDGIGDFSEKNEGNSVNIVSNTLPPPPPLPRSNNNDTNNT